MTISMNICNQMWTVCISMLHSSYGDINAAKVGEENYIYSVVCSHGICEMNNNLERLINFCGLNNLVVNGTIFPHRLMHKQA